MIEEYLICRLEAKTFSGSIVEHIHSIGDLLTHDV